MSAVPMIVTPEERTEREQEGAAILDQAQALAVRDHESFTAAAAWLRDTIAPLKRRITETFRPRIQQAYDLHKGLLADEKRFLGPVEEAERLIKGRLSTYEQEQERLRREEEERQRKERERLEAEERARIEAERLRLQKEAEDQALAAAAVAEQAGDTQLAERIIAAPPVVVAPAPRPVFTPPPAMAPRPQAAGVSFRDDWDFEIENAALIPREYLMPDEKKIRGVVKSMRGSIKIPGIKIIPKRVAAVRQS